MNHRESKKLFQGTIFFSEALIILNIYSRGFNSETEQSEFVLLALMLRHTEEEITTSVVLMTERVALFILQLYVAANWLSDGSHCLMLMP